MKNKLPKRKPLRVKNFDYNTPTAYFITICTHNRKMILSEIVGAINESPELKLTNYGEIVDNVIKNVPEHINASIEKFVVMPNHVHMIVLVGERAIRESPLRARTVLSKLIGYVKMCATKAIHKENDGMVVWQRGYHDRIIRNREEYEKIYKYICDNPTNWQIDCFYSDKED